MWFRTPDGRMQPWETDLNFETGAKITGQVSLANQIRDIFIPAQGEDTWFDREASGHIVDVSKWNGQINWAKLWNNADGAVVRMGYGAVKDERWQQNKAGLISGNPEKYKALYHFMNTGVDLQQQIDLVLSKIDLIADVIHAFWEDAESAYNDATSAAFKGNTLAIMRAVRSAFPHLKVGVYTNNPGWISLGQPKDWLQEFLFWYARYPYNPLTRYPTPPAGLTVGDIYMWQYWADGNQQGSIYGAEARDIDINCTRDQLGEFLLENLHDHDEDGEIVMPDPEKELQMRNEQELLLAAVQKHSDNIIDIALNIESEPEPEPLYQAEVTYDFLNVRSGPNTGYPKVKQLQSGDVVSVWKEQVGGAYTWAKISDSEDLWCATNWLKKL